MFLIVYWLRRPKWTHAQDGTNMGKRIRRATTAVLLTIYAADNETTSGVKDGVQVDNASRVRMGMSYRLHIVLYDDDGIGVERYGKGASSPAERSRDTRLARR
ncbi:hypothetical protein BD414DRAFT_471982 [Trametes punicea]|nr:hypothetical protein BD414DRAFT_471982 [Trametes punicea]